MTCLRPACCNCVEGRVPVKLPGKCSLAEGDFCLLQGVPWLENTCWALCRMYRTSSISPETHLWGHLGHEVWYDAEFYNLQGASPVPRGLIRTGCVPHPQHFLFTRSEVELCISPNSQIALRPTGMLARGLLGSPCVKRIKKILRVFCEENWRHLPPPADCL